MDLDHTSANEIKGLFRFHFGGSGEVKRALWGSKIDDEADIL